ncbi:hypothetical protein [uncultured Clostridium sp.]|uniref:hypothetical protein n=1 Tax=uncultured Clostridium sp. TaxID=59620 RepID=UPI00258B28E3|nr:hypothetical protein [uncultured Clostridium sp.]
MFVKVKKNKNCYSVYVCERKREKGKVISKDTKILTYGYHSLYDDFEDITFNEKLPEILHRMLRKHLKEYDTNICKSVVEKLRELKKEYYPTYKEICNKVDIEFLIKEQKEQEEYKKFKIKFKRHIDNELSKKYQEGFRNGQLSSVNLGKINNLDIDQEENKLLKEAFNLLSKKHHPDKGGNTEKMTKINNLREKILK